MIKEVDNGWSQTLTNYLVCHINNTVFYLLGVGEQFLISEKGDCYRKRRVTTYCYFT